MAESETECDTPGLDTLGSECVIAHSHVDLHYGAETEIMTEEKRGLELEIHGSDLKIQGLGTDLGAVACVDAIVAETDHDYIKVEHGEMHCFTGAEIKTTGNEALLGEVLLKAESEHVVKVESDHGGELTVESENGVIIHEAHGLQCNECGEIFGSIADLHQHFEIHKDLNPYICVHCGESFAVEASLKQHMKIHMKEKPYVPPGVEIMGKDTHLQNPVFSPPQPGKPMSYGTPPKQRVHQQGDKPYMCHHCDKGFNHSSSLSRHQRVHSEGKSYTCAHCGKRFNHSSSLARHQRVHLENKQQQQQQQPPQPQPQQYSTIPTGKGFPNNAFPKQRILSVEKPYRCSQCGKGFNHSSSLSRHHRIHVDQ
ncbi:zinc finger protein 883-like protein [Lates japonicus]|uniref:Zinc finger protein 883-like protein n=1 Tax=Lates japonicus TaxID=270547 RepID=A0AAD3N3E7_LATJO|nr:zinc finger protein 883-like protein [Lates japonicus]